MLHHLGVTLRLQLRNRMGLLYGYLFPTIFLVAFWVLYRYEQVPLARHMGELLTVTALGGACFGLPTALVSERERGVWRRYRLAPVSTGRLVTGTLLARYLLLLSAALLQLVLALLIGMPLPRHPLDLWLAFSLVAFAFLGLGLVIATLADTVPAVQALGQCIFLPMLILGGVAVRLEALPAWAQHLSAFFPGRWAVEALQRSVTGAGLGEARFALLALLLIGAAATLAGGRMFRWDAQQRFAARADRGWVAVALAAWLAVGGLAEATGAALPGEPDAAAGGAVALAPVRVDSPAPAAAPEPEPRAAAAAADTAADTAAPEPGAAEGAGAAPPDTAARAAATPPRSPPPTPPAERAPPPAPTPSAPWQAVTLADIDRDIAFDRLPPDGGVVTPIARLSERDDPFVADQLDCMRRWLPEWEPARVADPVQRVRNYLFVAAVPDMYQMEEIESLVPLVVFERLQEDFPRDQLIKILYWVAMHPDEGDAPSLERLSRLCLDAYGRVNQDELRMRTSMYAAKLLGRLTGRITPR